MVELPRRVRHVGRDDAVLGISSRRLRTWILGSAPDASSFGETAQPKEDLRRPALGATVGGGWRTVRHEVRPGGVSITTKADPNRALRRHRDLRVARPLPRSGS